MSDNADEYFRKARKFVVMANDARDPYAVRTYTTLATDYVRLARYAAQRDISELLHEDAFEPEVTRLMGEAVDLARRSLRHTGQEDLVKEIIAKRIIDSVRRGVRDPRQMCEESLSSLGMKSDYE
jgi:hypothetical protein